MCPRYIIVDIRGTFSPILSNICKILHWLIVGALPEARYPRYFGRKMRVMRVELQMSREWQFGMTVSTMQVRFRIQIDVNTLNREKKTKLNTIHLPCTLDPNNLNGIRVWFFVF